jgi:hypothetical protein
MTGWIESITELINVGHSGLTFSLSDVKYLIPGSRVCLILVLYVAFLMFCVWDDIRSEDRHDQESDIDPK